MVSGGWTVTRQQVSDILADLQRDAKTQSPATITLRRMLQEKYQRMETERTAVISISVKRLAGEP